MYRVAWKDNSSNLSGHGSGLTLELATAWVVHGNAKHPDITHWVEQVDENDQTQPTS